MDTDILQLAHPRKQLSTIVWRAVWFNVIALVVVFGLAYGAGAYSGGLSMLDFGALSFAAGVRLWIAALFTVVGVMSLMWLATRVLQPVQLLCEFARSLDDADLARPELPSTGDDFAEIADRLRAASDRLTVCATDQQRLAEFELRVAEFSSEMRQVSQGDLAVRIASADGPLADAFAAVNASLDMVTRVLDRGRALSEHAGDTARQSAASVQQLGKTLVEQQTELSAATSAFDSIPPALKQIADSADAAIRAAQAAVASGDQGRQQAAAAQSEIQRLAGSLRSAVEVLAGVRQASEKVSEMLRSLGTVTERANLLALNAAIEAARAGQAGRTSWIFAEQFRDLAQQSNQASAQLATLMDGIQHDCRNALHAVEGGAQIANECELQATRATQSVDAASAAVHEAGARAEVIALVAGRQADVARNVGAAVQAAGDLRQLAAQQARQAAAVSDEVLKLHSELNTALGMVRTPVKSQTSAARASTATE